VPPIRTWYLTTKLPRPASHRAADSPHAPVDLAEIVRLYGLRNWVEQGYKQVKQELGWADFMVRSDRAIRRHWHRVCCAFSLCWQAWFTEEARSARTLAPATQAETSAHLNSVVPAGRGENGRRFTRRPGLHHHLAGDS